MTSEYDVMERWVASLLDQAVDSAIAAENRRYLARPEAERRAEIDRQRAGRMAMGLLRLLNPAAARAEYDRYTEAPARADRIAVARPLEHGEVIHELLRSAAHRAQQIGTLADHTRQAEVAALLHAACTMHDLATGESIGTLTIRRRWLDAIGMPDADTSLFDHGRSAQSFVRAMHDAGHRGWHPADL